jgi:hypothetical protein
MAAGRTAKESYMKKAAYLLFMFLFYALASCASFNEAMLERYMKTWDEMLPESETTVIAFFMATVTSYNGVAIEKGYRAIKIPVGNAGFTINTEFNARGATYRANDMEFDFFFEAEKLYFASSVFRSDDKDDEVVGVDIYVWNSVAEFAQRDMKRSSDHYVAFVPFKIQPAGWKRSYF